MPTAVILTPAPAAFDKAAKLDPAILAAALVESDDVDGLHIRLAVRFFDGVAGISDMSELVRSPEAGVFSALYDLQRFVEVFVEYGAVTWSGELDLAPDAMHTQLRDHGEWRPA